MPYSVIPVKPNLFLLDPKTATTTVLRYSSRFRRISILDINNMMTDCIKLIETGQIIERIRHGMSLFPESLKSQSVNIMRAWTRQCECVLAQRLRRGQQMFCLYTRLWEERALREFIRRMRHSISRHGTEFLCAAVGLAAYDWDENRVKDDEIKVHLNELEYIKELRGKTMVCSQCRNCLTCTCANSKKSYVPYDNWTVFIEKQDMIVWRRLHKTGSYEYKVYGSFNDVCAEDFLNVQIDIDYRRKWDSTAVTLDIIEKDPNPEANGDIVYWEMLWPRLFANRDYVFLRRYMVDLPSKILLLVSKCTTHPKYPVASNKYRVTDYTSHMIIKPYGDFFSPGIEFGLTYYDNPGTNIPAAVTAWVAYRAMPDFLTKLRSAAKEYQAYCETSGCDRTCDLRKLMEKDAEEKRDRDLQKLDDGDVKNIILERDHMKQIKPKDGIQERIPGIDIMTSPSPIVQADVSKQNYWKYLQPTYYFS